PSSFSEFGSLARHLRYVQSTSRRLARQQFHLMVTHGPALERRQMLLFRCVDVGAELFAMAAVCSRAVRDVKKNPAEKTPIELADIFCRQAKRRIAALFEAVRANDDTEIYRVAKGVLEDRYGWLEKGIVAAPTEGAGVPDERGVAAS